MFRIRSLKRNSSVASLLTLILTITFVMIGAPAAAGGGVSKLKGDIIINKKGRFPSKFDSNSEMAKYMRRVNTHEVHAEGDDDWEFEYMAFLPKPVATLQAAVTFYDVTVPGTQKLVDTFTFYPADRKQDTLNGHARLSSAKFKPNRKYLMVFSRGYGQRALAQTKVVLRRK